LLILPISFVYPLIFWLKRLIIRHMIESNPGSSLGQWLREKATKIDQVSGRSLDRKEASKRLQRTCDFLVGFSGIGLVVLPVLTHKTPDNFLFPYYFPITLAALETTLLIEYVLLDRRKDKIPVSDTLGPVLARRLNRLANSLDPEGAPVIEWF